MHFVLCKFRTSAKLLSDGVSVDSRTATRFYIYVSIYIYVSVYLYVCMSVCLYVYMFISIHQGHEPIVLWDYSVGCGNSRVSDSTLIPGSAGVVLCVLDFQALSRSVLTAAPVRIG